MLGFRDGVVHPNCLLLFGRRLVVGGFGETFPDLGLARMIKELVSVLVDPFSVVDCKSTTSHFLRPLSCYFCNTWLGSAPTATMVPKRLEFRRSKSDFHFLFEVILIPFMPVVCTHDPSVVGEHPSRTVTRHL